MRRGVVAQSPYYSSKTNKKSSVIVIYMKNTNTTQEHHIIKKIKNWGKYTESLRNRGNIGVFISESIIRNDRIVPPKKSHRVGHPCKYSEALIEFTLVIRELFHLPLRQTTGFVPYLFKLMHLSADVPDYTTLSRRAAKLHVQLKNLVSKSREAKEPIVMLIDSSGFKVFGEGEWKVRKHGSSYHRTWRETHIALDWETRDFIELTNTSAHVHDNTQLKPLLKKASKNHQVATIIGDGAYDSKDNYLLARKLGIKLITPPPKTAVEHLNFCRGEWYDTPNWKERNDVVRHIEEWGLDGWKADVDYHRRSLVENAFYRMKAIFGDRLKFRKVENQYTEQRLKAKIINKFNKLGLPEYELVR